MEKIHLAFKNSYGWCKLSGSAHWRLLCASYQGSVMCSDCLNLLRHNGIEVSENQVHIVPPDTTKKRLAPTGKKYLRSSNFQARIMRSLSTRIIAVLQTGLYTYKQIKWKAARNQSDRELKKALQDLIKFGLIVYAKYSRKDEILYTVSQRNENLQLHFKNSYFEIIPKMLENDPELSIAELSAKLKTPKTTIARWIKILDKENIIATEIRRKGLRGCKKVCRLR